MTNPDQTILFRLGVPELRKRLKLVGFRGSVRALTALGPIENANLLCAYVHCTKSDVHEVFVNTEVVCSHHHLVVDVMDLVNAFKNGDLDRGWNVLPGGDATTGVLTREAAAQGRIPASQWARNPYRPES